MFIISYRQFVSPTRFFLIIEDRYPLTKFLLTPLSCSLFLTMLKFKSTRDHDSRLAYVTLNYVCIALAYVIFYRALKMLMVWLDKYLDRDFFFHDKGNRLFDQLLKFIAYMGEDEEDIFRNKSNELKLLILRVPPAVLL